jgi:hypothetical protein
LKNCRLLVRSGVIRRRREVKQWRSNIDH